MKQLLDKYPRTSLGLKLLVIAAFALAVTVPFASQPFSLDGPLVIDFATAQVENPAQQHIDDFDYFGVHYDRFTNTHPRFLSLYLSQFIRIFGASEVAIHLALTVFPIIGGIGIFFLGRRFKVNGMAAAVLFLAGPAALVSAHTEMVDMPGTCLWIASLAAFIYGVDRKKKLLLTLAGFLFILTIYTFYQGLTVPGLALIYLFLQRKFSLRNLTPVAAAIIVFLAYLLLFYLAYGEPPRFSYRIPLLGYEKSLLHQLRGLLVIIGGTLMFPLVIATVFLRNWRFALAGAFASACAWPWLAVRHAGGAYSLYETLALGLFVTIGAVVVYAIAEISLIAAIAWFRRKDSDIFLPGAWFFAVFSYCAVFLGYPSPRYFLPAMPAVILITLWLYRRNPIRWRYLRAALTGSAFAITILFSLAAGIAYRDYAYEGRDTAAWVLEEYGDSDGRVWFSGDLGFAYYMRRNGFTMAPGIMWDRYSQTSLNRPAQLPQPGDILVNSRLTGGMLPYPDVIPYLRFDQKMNTWSRHPLVIWSRDTRSSWGISLLLPFIITDRPLNVDEVTVWRIDSEAAPLTPDVRAVIDEWH